MTITTLILLLATGIVAVTAEDNCPNQNTSITNCCDVKSSNFFTFGKNAGAKASSGIYLIKNFCGKDCINAEAYCDTSSGGGGWLVVQRRQDGSVDFNRTWLEYEDGFGELTGEFWYGLKALHCLTGQGGWGMRMDVTLVNGTNIILQYEQFQIAPAKDKYKLTLGGFQGTIRESLISNHNGGYFTTKDRDNDRHGSTNCATFSTSSTGGWWYHSCGATWPNGSLRSRLGISLNGKWHSFQFMEIKIQPNNCNN